MRPDNDKLDVTCIGCSKKVYKREISKFRIQKHTNGGYWLEHECDNGNVHASMLVWKGKDGVWRRKPS